MTKKLISLTVIDGIILVNEEDIIWLSANDKSTDLYLENEGELLIMKNIGYIERLLDKELFFKTHRSYIINIRKIKKVKKGCTAVILNNGKDIPVSRYRKKEFITKLNKLCRNMVGQKNEGGGNTLAISNIYTSLTTHAYIYTIHANYYTLQLKNAYFSKIYIMKICFFKKYMQDLFCNYNLIKRLIDWLIFKS
jgi:hypothetical protein